MPSDLPIIRVRTTQENINKLKIIAKEHNRSMSGELEYELLQLIKRYEEKHGEISINVNNNSGIIIGENKGTIHM